MMLEHAFNFFADHNFLRRIAQQVAHHAHATGMRQGGPQGRQPRA